MLKFFLHKLSSVNIETYVNYYRKSLRTSFYDFYFLDTDTDLSITNESVNMVNFQLN